MNIDSTSLEFDSTSPQECKENTKSASLHHCTTQLSNCTKSKSTVEYSNPAYIDNTVEGTDKSILPEVCSVCQNKLQCACTSAMQQVENISADKCSEHASLPDNQQSGDSIESWPGPKIISVHTVTHEIPDNVVKSETSDVDEKSVPFIPINFQSFTSTSCTNPDESVITNCYEASSLKKEENDEAETDTSLSTFNEDNSNNVRHDANEIKRVHGAWKCNPCELSNLAFTHHSFGFPSETLGVSGSSYLCISCKHPLVTPSFAELQDKLIDTNIHKDVFCIPWHIFCSKCGFKHTVEFNIPVNRVYDLYQSLKYPQGLYELDNQSKRGFCGKFVAGEPLGFMTVLSANEKEIDLNPLEMSDKVIQTLTSVDADSMTLPQVANGNQPFVPNISYLTTLVDILPGTPVHHSSLPSTSKSATISVTENLHPVFQNVSTSFTSDVDLTSTDSNKNQQEQCSFVNHAEPNIGLQNVEFIEDIKEHSDVYWHINNGVTCYICSRCFSNLKKDEIAMHYLKHHQNHKEIKNVFNVIKL